MGKTQVAPLTARVPQPPVEMTERRIGSSRYCWTPHLKYVSMFVALKSHWIHWKISQLHLATEFHFSIVTFPQMYLAVLLVTLIATLSLNCELLYYTTCHGFI